MAQKRLKIGFIWQGFSGRYGQWRDGLYRAMKRIEERHDVRYMEPWDDFTGCDVLLYWEAPCTIHGENGEFYRRVKETPTRKALLYAGGPWTPDMVEGFDHVFVESALNEKEFEMNGISWSRAFGINEDIFFPMDIPKAYDGFMQATFAAWKRQPLFAEALGAKGVLCGRYQANDKEPWEHSAQSIRLPEMPYSAVNALLNASHTAVNTSEFWGGGQRCTLEAMAAGVPVIVMEDSPKNREYVEESGAGLVVDPGPIAIREAVETIKGWSDAYKKRGVEYIKSKWTSKHYADAIMQWL